MIDSSLNYKKIKRRSNNDYTTHQYRLPWLDALRGLTVISMVFYHYMWDMVYVHGFAANWYTGPLGYIWQQSICWSFILISGFSFGISKKPIYRGVVVSVCGIVISLVTVLFLPELSIKFGVLTMIGACMIIFGILKPVLKNIPSILGLLFSIGLFVFTRDVNVGYFGFEGIKFFSVPSFLYSNYLTTFLGFPFEGFFSTDYFSLFPWMFLFLTGFFLYKLYYDLQYVSEEHDRPVYILGHIGKASLAIYILHQPIIYMGIWLAYMIFGR